jgi:hypothetical protein
MPDGAERQTGGAAPGLEVVHATEGRLRLRLSRRMDAGEIERLVEQIAGVAGIDRVIARPATGSVILSFRGPAEDLVEALNAGLGIKVRPQRKPPPVGQALQFGLMKLDADVLRTTEKSLDLRALLVLLLLFAAVVQLARGRIAGPATTLAMTAFSLLDPARLK